MTGREVLAMSSSQATTRNVRVEVEARYVPERSQPKLEKWLFEYRVRISNHAEETVQLQSRHWIITDANGRREEVRGPGVVGQHPILAPRETFEYTSFCPLGTPFGTMQGTYQMVTMDGKTFDAEIAPFTLSEPYSVN